MMKSQERKAAIEAAKAGAGIWVKSSSMDPYSNISGRVFKTTDGQMDVWQGQPNRSEIEAWFYPD